MLDNIYICIKKYVQLSFDRSSVLSTRNSFGWTSIGCLRQGHWVTTQQHKAGRKTNMGAPIHIKTSPNMYNKYLLICIYIYIYIVCIGMWIHKYLYNIYIYIYILYCYYEGGVQCLPIPLWFQHVEIPMTIKLFTVLCTDAPLKV